MYLLGQTALSAFRLQAYRKKLNLIASNYIYFLELAAELNPEDEQHLQELLHVDEMELGANYVITLPRFVSPWSSRATEILHNCGIQAVKRVERGIVWTLAEAVDDNIAGFNQLYDRMTEQLIFAVDDYKKLFQHDVSRPLQHIPLMSQGLTALINANQNYGLALSPAEIEYLATYFNQLQRDPTDAELMMFAQANSEHCRHKIFNATWTIDGIKQEQSLFAMIRHTHQANPNKILVAYDDNAAVMQGYTATTFGPDIQRNYREFTRNYDILFKVETHNHPTAIEPYAGAATGAGGEIRDEAATGRGAKPKAGLTGFAVSNLLLPNLPLAWEIDYGKPQHIASAMEIMLKAPIGASRFNNEFGRPNICGFFRSFEQEFAGKQRGYHKPIMLAGGLGSITQHQKKPIPDNAYLIVLGGAAMLIGLGGGAASSMAAGCSEVELDFASVQRANPEMQRRSQEVINACWILGEKNPILSIHDVGAGGLSNAIPELVHQSHKGAIIELSKIPSADSSLSPMELWCNEAQERYVLAIGSDADLSIFEQICQRERCPYAILGQARLEPKLIVHPDVVNMSLETLLTNPPKSERQVSTQAALSGADLALIPDLSQAIQRVLSHPTVADKQFLITIADRTVGGLTVRDQLVGPWQVAVADCGVTASGFYADTGEAMAIGERTPLALLSPAAAARLAVAEAITNIAAANIADLTDIALSANWMAACGQAGEDAALFEAVQAVTTLCQQLGINIPVGKDSLSMHSQWQQDDENKAVTAPLSLIISAYARVANIHRTLTPQLVGSDSKLLLLDLGQQRLGGSILLQSYNAIGQVGPDLTNPLLLKQFFHAIQSLNQQGKILAYHDRSDGGLLATVAEMMFAGGCGVDLHLDSMGSDSLAILFNEELGAVIEIANADVTTVQAYLTDLGIPNHLIGQVNNSDNLQIYHQKLLFSDSRVNLRQIWSKFSYALRELRDNPECVSQEYANLANAKDKGLFLRASFKLQPAKNKSRAKIAILREQGVNGQTEMAAAFHYAGFDCVDVHTSDILNKRVSLQQFRGLVACGGFSFGDVLGAGGGWAKSILYHEHARNEFKDFFQREDTFGLGVCNGCQMLSQLKTLIPGADLWPEFITNKSEQFEARLSMVLVDASPSIFFKGMAGSAIPIVVSHAEGRVIEFGKNNELLSSAWMSGTIALRHIDNDAQLTEHYPANPNGTMLGVAGLSTFDGRFTIMMPHPERVFLTSQFSYLPKTWTEKESPWMQMFWNAREWV